MSGARIAVKAEPKQGYKPPSGPLSMSYARGPGGGDEGDPGAARDPFRVVDYENLRDIVVWLEPRDVPGFTAPTSGPVTMDLAIGQGTAPTVAAAVGGKVHLQNRSQQTVAVYLRSDAGAITDAGTMSPGTAVAVTMTAPGAIEVLADAGGESDPLLGRIFVAPNAFVRTVRSGETIILSPAPPGRYDVHSWHPRLPGQSASVVLQPDQVSDVSVVVGVNVLPKVSP